MFRGKVEGDSSRKQPVLSAQQGKGLSRPAFSGIKQTLGSKQS